MPLVPINSASSVPPTPPTDKLATDLVDDLRFVCRTHAHVIGEVAAKYDPGSGTEQRQPLVYFSSNIADLESGDAKRMDGVGHEQRRAFFEHCVLLLDDISKGHRPDYRELHLLRAMPNVEAGLNTIDDPVLENEERQLLVDMRSAQKNFINPLYDALKPYHELNKALGIFWRIKGQELAEVHADTKKHPHLRDAAARLEAVQKVFHDLAADAYKPDTMQPRQYDTDIYKIESAYTGGTAPWQGLARVRDNLVSVRGDIDYFNLPNAQVDKVRKSIEMWDTQIMGPLTSLQQARKGRSKP